MHGTITIKPRKWTARDEWYLRAAIENAAYHRDMLSEQDNARVHGERLDCIERADRNLAALLARKEAAKEAA